MVVVIGPGHVNTSYIVYSPTSSIHNENHL